MLFVYNVFICLLRVSEYPAIISMYNINRLVFVLDGASECLVCSGNLTFVCNILILSSETKKMEYIIIITNDICSILNLNFTKYISSVLCVSEVLDSNLDRWTENFL
jgi:hypothetical protein